MKILLVHNYYKSHLIGGEDLVFKREYNALINSLGKDNVFCYEECNDNLTFLSLLKNIFFSRKHYKNVFDLVKKEHIDLVHVHNFFPLLSPSVFKAAKQAGAKVIHTLHNYRWWCIGGILYQDKIGICEECAGSRFNSNGVRYGCYRNSKLQSLVAAAAFYIYKKLKLLNYVDCFFVLTKFQRDKLLEFQVLEEKIQVKPNFNTENLVKVRNSKPKSGFLFIGRLEESKGIIDLIENWRFDKSLTIIGDGPLKYYVEQRVSKNICYLGNLPNEQVKQKLAEVKYLLQMSKLYETFGLTIIEAFQMGTPVIGLDVGTRKDFIIDGYNGFLLNDISKLDLIIEKACQCNYYNDLVNNAILTSKNFSQNQVISLQISLYEKILGEKKF